MRKGGRKTSRLGLNMQFTAIAGTRTILRFLLIDGTNEESNEEYQNCISQATLVDTMQKWKFRLY